MTIRIKAVPNSNGNEIVGWEEDPRAGRVLKVRLQAPPVEGKANKALVAFLAKEFGVAKSAVKLVKGETSRLKTVEVPDGVTLP